MTIQEVTCNQYKHIAGFGINKPSHCATAAWLTKVYYYKRTLNPRTQLGPTTA